jgi:uncharacterized protein (DUF1684 family)
MLPLLIAACNTKSTQPMTNSSYQKEMQEWQARRLTELTAADSWLSLAGLFWLKEGRNTFGANSSNDIVFPKKAAPQMGAFILENGQVKMKINKDIKVLVDGKDLKEVMLVSDVAGKTTQMKWQTFSWYLIEREGRFAIRLKDSQNADFQSFKGLSYFPVTEKWKVPAYLKPVAADKTISLRNVIDMDVTMKLEGYLSFEIDGKNYELEAMNGGPDLYFIIFADETTGVETYGAGRYMYMPRVDETGKTYLDFNKAYNPPCAFTDFATCPLPSAKNRLDLAIKAGEKNYKHH